MYERTHFQNLLREKLSSVVFVDIDTSATVSTNGPVSGNVVGSNHPQAANTGHGSVGSGSVGTVTSPAPTSTQIWNGQQFVTSVNVPQAPAPWNGWVNGVAPSSQMMTAQSPQTTPAAPQELTIGITSIPGVLPKIIFEMYDDRHHKNISMEMQPEGTISGYEALQLTMMLFIVVAEPTSFSVLEYVRKNNLERHFKFKG